MIMQGRDPKFSSIGFTLSKEEDVLPLANTIADQSETETFGVELGNYLHWSGDVVQRSGFKPILLAVFGD